jgi:hypothetical protein
MIHYLFACHPGWQYFYIGLMLTLGIVVVTISMSSYFQVRLDQLGGVLVRV